MIQKNKLVAGQRLGMNPEREIRAYPYFSTCMNCGAKYMVEYNDNGNPVSLWCRKCRSQKDRITKQFKRRTRRENKTDPMFALAKMKLMLDRCYEDKIDGRLRVNKSPTHVAIRTEGPLYQLKRHMDKIKIPKKYLIAESL